MTLATGLLTCRNVLPQTSYPQTSNGLIRQLQADLERHAGFGDKYSGGPGDLATAGWIAERLEKTGYTVNETTFAAPFFIKRSASLSLGNSVQEVVPQAPVVTTHGKGIRKQLVLVEQEVGDVRDRIAVFVTPFGRHAALFPQRGIGQTVTAIAKAGAVAIIIVTEGPSGEAIALNAPEQPFVPIPAAVLAPKYAGLIIDAARAGKEATLIIDGEATHRPSKNIIARLKRGEKWLAISTPRSGWYQCVAERGTGTAAFLDLADWTAERFPDLSIFLMNTGGHEYFFAGTRHVLDQVPPVADTLAWVHIGATLAARAAEQRGESLVMLDRADTHRSILATEMALAAVKKGFAGLAGLEQPVAVMPQAGELSTFTGLGFKTAFAVLGVHDWFHTVEDTLERVDARLLVPVLEAHKRTIELIVAANRD